MALISGIHKGTLDLCASPLYCQTLRSFRPAILLTKKSHHITGKNNIKPLITRMNTDTKKRARVHSLREWGRVKQKLCKQACKIFAFFCQSQIDGIIRAHLRNPWLVLLQPHPARGLLKT